ncbi:GlsB/YeaQ/YmgE family stress response membrane protein [Trichococcus alkaliphilus]|uniref:GlsB/YeaQ/YmgE family stress response membrane protein n=1 Tax=Trichococcus alkaliphilus TaxID=2052943 RepID=UPI000D0B4F80|nr:GlsB/YeaQ/YmgE family stress response membrane protein [Trichococcus alkaliphilus]
MDFLWSLIVGGVLGALAGAFLGKNVPGGIIGNIIAGFVGSWLGVTLFGAWGPAIGGFYIAPALIGAIILILIVSLIMKSMRK